MEQPLTQVDFQDMVWAFFQNCWHVKDWVWNDPIVPQVTKDAVSAMAHSSVVLKVCQEMCNGTKHLAARRGASHDSIDTTIVPGGETINECVIDRGDGELVSGRMLAISAWPNG